MPGPPRPTCLFPIGWTFPCAPPLSHAAAAFAIGLIGTLMACRDVIDPPDPGDVVLVSVSPTAAVLVPGQDLQVTGVVRDRLPRSTSGRAVTWTSARSRSRRRSRPRGLVAGGEPGEVVITVSVGRRLVPSPFSGSMKERGSVRRAGRSRPSAARSRWPVPENAVASPTADPGRPPFDAPAGSDGDRRRGSPCGSTGTLAAAGGAHDRL